MLVLGLMACTSTGCPFTHNHPSDRDLAALFEEHRSGFDTLRRMLDDDPELLRVAWDFYGTRISRSSHKPSALLPRKRWATYRELFRELQLANGVRQQQAGKYGRAIFFYVSSGGILDSTSTKGIAYTSEPPEALRNSLDDPLERGIQYGYKHIEGNWYIFFGYAGQR